MNKGVGKRNKNQLIKPLTTTGDISIDRFRIQCIETWNAKKVDLNDVKEKWFKKYDPSGYDTIVIGKIEKGILTTTTIRYKSCD